MDVVWKQVPGLVGSYEVSSDGQVRSLDRRIYRGHNSALLTGRVLKQAMAGKGYRVVSIGGRTRYVHRLVMEAFVGPCPKGMEVCHNNGVRTDNRLDNLRYDTPSSNNRDKARHGTDHNASKSHCLKGHEYTEENTVRRPDGNRRCRTCRADRAREEMRRQLSTPEGRAAHAAKIREWRRRAGRVDDLGNQWARRTHCSQGHEYTPENTIQRTDGGRRCRTCKIAADRAKNHESAERRKNPEARAKRNAYLRERRRNNGNG